MDSLDCYRFQPTPERLVSVLKKRRLDPSFTDPTIKELDIYKYHPSELPGLSSIQTDEQVWYFLSTLKKKYEKGELVRRTAEGGSWKITGSDRDVKDKHGDKKIGIKKTLVFYKGRNTKKENKTNWVMHEFHECLPSKDPVDKLVICRIERKPEKKCGPSSAPDGGQPSDNLAYEPGNNVAEDILEVEPQPLQDHHLPSSFSNDVANNSLLEVGSQLLPNSYISHVTKNNFQELASQLLPNQHISSNGDLVAKNISSELDSQLLPNQHMYPIIGDHPAKTIYSELEYQSLLPNYHMSSTIEDQTTNKNFSELTSQLLSNPHMSCIFKDHVSKNMFVENVSRPLPNQHLSCNIENDAGKGILSEVEPQPLQDHHLSSSFNNDVVNNSLQEVGSQLLPNSYISELESQLLPNRYLSCTTEDRVANISFPELESQSLLPNYHMFSTTEDQTTNNSFSEIESQLLPTQHLSSNVENHAGKGILSEVQPQVPVQGNELRDCSRMDHNSLSTLQSLVYPMPGFSNSTNFSNDLTPWLEHNSLSAVRSTVYPPPGSSYSSSFTNNLTDRQLYHNSFSALQLPIHPQPGSSCLSKFSNYSTNGFDCNSLSALHFPIHSPPESSYSSNLSNDSTNGLDCNSFSTLPSLIRPQPGSSYSPDFRNDSNVWNIPFAAEQKDELTNLHGSVQDDVSSPETGHASRPASYFNSSEGVAGSYVCNGTGRISAWPNEQFPMANGEYPSNNTFVNHGYVPY